VKKDRHHKSTPGSKQLKVSVVGGGEINYAARVKYLRGLSWGFTHWTKDSIKSMLCVVQNSVAAEFESAVPDNHITSSANIEKQVKKRIGKTRRYVLKNPRPEEGRDRRRRKRGAGRGKRIDEGVAQGPPRRLKKTQHSCTGVHTSWEASIRGGKARKHARKNQSSKSKFSLNKAHVESKPKDDSKERKELERGS